MKKIYCLSTCSTCNRILGEIGADKEGFTLQYIKTEKITPALIGIKIFAGSEKKTVASLKDALIG